MVVLSWHRSLIWKKVHLSRLAIVGNRLVWFFYIGQNRWVFHIGWYRPIPIIFPISTDPNFKWPNPLIWPLHIPIIQLEETEMDMEKSISILLQTSPNSSLHLPNSSKPGPHLSKCVQTRPNVSKRVQMHLNAPNLSKIVQKAMDTSGQ